MNTYKVSILTVGDEILIGQTVNTNAAKIGQIVSSLGAEIVASSVCPDNKEAMLVELERLENISDSIIITGGLGPTHDDITKSVLTEYYDDETVVNEEELIRIKEYFKIRKREFKDINIELARIPNKCLPIRNNVGTAPGMHFPDSSSKKNVDVFSLPGVPREMMAMMEEYVASYIESQLDNSYDVQAFRTIETSGRGESDLADLIGSVDSFLKSNTSLAYLPSTRGVRLRLGAIGKFEETEKELDELEKLIESKVGQFIVGKGDADKKSTIKELLDKQKLSVSVAESCTSGLLGAYLTEISGSSSYFKGGILSYSNEVKKSLLSVKEYTLEQYGAVSEETAREMADGCRVLLGTDISISITGIAGSGGGTDEKPVGLVWVALSDSKGIIAKRFNFGRSRETNRELAVSAATNMLLLRLKENYEGKE
ncbi:MAG: competence/damage-inducible protein A [Candidatus Kapaibacteriales bacterium]